MEGRILAKAAVSRQLCETLAALPVTSLPAVTFYCCWGWRGERERARGPCQKVLGALGVLPRPIVLSPHPLPPSLSPSLPPSRLFFLNEQGGGERVGETHSLLWFFPPHTHIITVVWGTHSHMRVREATTAWRVALPLITEAPCCRSQW